MSLLSFLSIIAVVGAFPRQYESPFHKEINLVNSIKTTWTAGVNFGPEVNQEYVKGLCGVLKEKEKLKGIIYLSCLYTNLSLFSFNF